jgi:hypothetical protein
LLCWWDIRKIDVGATVSDRIGERIRWITVGQTATLDLSESGIQIWCVWPTYAFELWVVHGQTESAWQVQWPH